MARVVRGKGGRHSNGAWKGRSSFQRRMEERDNSDDEDSTEDR